MQLVILRIELGQNLPGLDALPQFHAAPNDLARHPKAQLRFHARTDFARILRASMYAISTNRNNFDGADRLLRRNMLGAAAHNKGDNGSHGQDVNWLEWHGKNAKSGGVTAGKLQGLFIQPVN